MSIYISALLGLRQAIFTNHDIAAKNPVDMIG
jgi:hypothetical protein